MQPLALEHPWAQALYVDFAQWLAAHGGQSNVLAARYRAQSAFFERLDALYSTADAIDAASLLSHFDVATLRRHLLATRFLQQRLGVTISDEAKREAAEQSRVREILIEAKRTPWHSVLREYIGWLQGRGTAIRTVRLYLRAASNLHSHAKRIDDRIESIDVQRYLRSSPGARASLFPYISFGRQALGWEARLPTSKPSRQDPAQRLSALMAQIEKTGVDQIPTAVLERALCIAFAIRVDRLRRSLIHADGCILVLNREGPVEIPLALQAIAAQWARAHATVEARPLA